MQQYTALPAVIALPLTALYMALYDGQPSNMTINSRNSSRLSVVGPGSNFPGELTEIPIAEEEELEISALDTLIWIKEGNISSAALGSKVLRMYTRFLEDTPGHCFYWFNHFLCFLCFHLIMKHSIVGILTKILCKRLNESRKYCFASLVYLKDIVGTYRSNLFHQDPDELVNESNIADQLIELVPDTSEEFMECTSSSTIFKLQKNCSVDTKMNLLLQEKLSGEKYLAGNYVDALDKGYESFVQSMHLRIPRSECSPTVVRNSTPREDSNVASASIMEAVPTEKFKRFLHQRNEMVVDKVEVRIMDDEEGCIMDDESGDESLCTTRSILF